MPISGDTRQALQLLERIQQQLRDSSETHLTSAVGEDLNTLISVLDSPVFNSILTIQDSLQELKRQLHKHPSILPVDFDISPTTGELVLSVPSDPTPLQNSDSYEPSSDPEQNYEFDTHLLAPQGDINCGTSPELTPPVVVPPDYALSTITTDSYAEEFRRTITQGAQGREIHTIQLYKPEGSSLGFSVVGLRSEARDELGIFVQEIQLNGIAGKDGRLQEGDQILAIDGQPLDSNISHQQAISILQQARGLVELIVARGGIPSPDQPLETSLERSPSVVSDSSKGSDMVLNTEWAQVEAVDLVNDGSGLGFGIIGGRSTGVVVKTILPGGVADRNGRLQSGDHILQIGEVNLRGMGSEQVAMVLRQSGSHVRLIVARPVEPASPDYNALHSSAPIVPTRILADPEEVERHLTMFQQAQNGYTEPLTYKSSKDYNGPFIYEQTRVDVQVPYPHPLLPPEEQPVPLEVGGEETEGKEKLPEMESFEVELVKDQQGLGITIAGYVCEKDIFYLCNEERKKLVPQTTDEIAKNEALVKSSLDEHKAQEEISGIFVKSIAKGSAADLCGQIRVNDQVIEVDGRPLHGYTNHQAVEVLRNTGKVVKLRLARYLRGAKYQQLQHAIAVSGEPHLLSSSPPQLLSSLSSHLPSSTTKVQIHEPHPPQVIEATNEEVDLNDINICIDDDYSKPLCEKEETAIQGKWSKIMGPEYEIIVVQLSKFREGGGLGISLEGTVDVEDGREVRPHHYIRSILSEGPVGMNGKLYSGDELLEVNGNKLLGLNHIEVVSTLKELPMHVRMVCARLTHPPVDDLPPSSSVIDSSLPYPVFSSTDNDAADGIGKGMLISGLYGGSLTSLTPVSERLVKAKSDGSLAVGTSASSSPPVETALSKLKSRSLEPLTGLAMWSSEPQIIELVKGERGLGFSILDYQDPMNPNETVIVIRSLVPGGVAQQDGRLIPGDRLLFVNDINLENASLDAAVQALKGAPKGVVRIGVAKPLPLPESSQSGQVNLDEIKRLPDFHLQPSIDIPPPSLQEIDPLNVMLESDQPSSLPSNLPSSNVEFYVEQKPKSEIKEDSISLPPGDQEWTYNIAPLPVALERTARIKKGTDTLGISIEVLDSVGVVVKSIAPGCAVDKDGRIEVGDFLMSINNESTKNIDDSQTRAILERAEQLTSDIIIKYIPTADAAVYHQSALLSFQDRSSSELTPQPSPSLSYSEHITSADSVKKNEDNQTVPLTVAPHSVLQSEENTFNDMNDDQVVLKTFDDSLIEQDTMDKEIETSEVISNTVLKDISPSFQERRAVFQVAHPKPAVPSKPIKKSITKGSSQQDLPPSSLNGATTASIALDRQWGPKRSIELWRETSRGLGISITWGKVDMSHQAPGHVVSGIFIKNVLPDSPAGSDGTLKRGDRILEVGGIDLRNVTHDKAVEVIKNAKNPVTFVVQSLVPVPKRSEPDEMLAPPLPQSLPPDDDDNDLVHSQDEHSDTPTLWRHSISPPAPHISIDDKETDFIFPPSDDGGAPIPPPRTVSSLQKSPSPPSPVSKTYKSTSVSSASSSEDERDEIAEGEVLTKDEMHIDSDSAAHVKLSPEEKVGDSEEDEFAYTMNKIQKKYGDLKGELIVVDLQKGANKLGLSLAGNKDRTKMSVFVCGMHPSGNAAKDGRIRIGDELLEVNGLVMSGRCHLNASAMIKGLSGTNYKMILLRREGALDDMAVKPLTQFPAQLDEETPEDKYFHYRGMRTVTVRKAGLTVGDMILAVNQTELVGADYDTAASILKQAEGLIGLVVANPTKPSSGFHYEDRELSEVINKPDDKTGTIKPSDKRKGPPPLPPPKPSHLIGKTYSNTCTIASTTSFLSSRGRHSVAPTLVTSPQKLKLLPMPPITNLEDDISSSQENEPPSDPRKCEIKAGRETIIEITKEKMGLGLSIVGGSDTPLGVIIIHEVYPDGAAALDGRLKPGDQILEVNGEDLRDATHERAITALRQTPSVVQMLVYREEGQNHDEDIYDILDVELHKKPGRGLGLSIVGRKNGPGVFISEVVKGGVAEADGRLMQGDQILEVNGQDLKNSTQEYAAAILKTTMGRIGMKIGRLKAGSRRSTSGPATTPRVEENPDISQCKTIILERGPDGLGFSIVGGCGSPHGDLPIYVKKVFEKGAAADDGQLQRGDQIIAVNDQSLEGVTHEEAVAILKNMKGTVTLTVLS